MKKIKVLEPENLQDALARVESDHRFTQITLTTHRDKDPCGMYSGYGRTYDLITQRGYFTNLIGEDLARDGIELMKEEKQLEREAERLAVEQHFGKSLGRKKLTTLLDQHSSYAQDQVCDKARTIFLNDPRTLEHFEKQSKYEERLIDYLRSQLQTG